MSGKSGRCRGGGGHRCKIGERYLRPRKDQEDGGGKRAAVVRAQDKKGQTMETEGGREAGFARGGISCRHRAIHCALSRTSSLVFVPRNNLS